MSQPAIWAAVAGRPRFGVSTTVARAHPAATTAITAHARSRVDMLHLAVGGHAPGLDRVAVEDGVVARSEEHTSELQSRLHLVCRLLLEKKKTIRTTVRRRT